MAQVEERLAAAAPAQAPAAPPALPPPLESRPPPARPSDESSDDSSDRRKQEKKEKKKKKTEKRERRERERSQALGGVQASRGGGLRTRGRGEWWWTRGTGTGRSKRGLRLLTLPHAPPPPPQVAPQSRGPPVRHRPKGGGDRLVSLGAGAGMCGGSTAHGHMTIMWIFRGLIRCLIRRKEGEHRRTWGKDASTGGGVGSGNPSLVPPWPPCPRPRVRAVCPHSICCLTPPRPLRGSALPGAATALDPAGLGQAVAARQGRCVRGRLGRSPGPAPTRL